MPFSARISSERATITEAFPPSARAGLLHLLNEAVNSSYVAGWHSVAKEVRRIARTAVRNYDPHTVSEIKAAQEDTEQFINEMSWDRVFDFCERAFSHLATGYSYEYDGETVVVTTKAQSEEFFARETQRLFDEEGFAYEFMNGVVQRRGKRHTVAQIERAMKTLTDSKLESARKHFSKALRHFRDRHRPDYENAVKEAVCAVESAAKDLYPEAKVATLGEFIKWASSSEHRIFSKVLGQTFTGLYAFRNSAEGVSHGSTAGDVVTASTAEYVIALAASQVLLLADLVSETAEPPF